MSGVDWVRQARIERLMEDHTYEEIILRLDLSSRDALIRLSDLIRKFKGKAEYAAFLDDQIQEANERARDFRRAKGIMTVLDLRRALIGRGENRRIMITDGVAPRDINYGPVLRKVTGQDAQDCAECEGIVGEDVWLIGFGEY